MTAQLIFLLISAVTTVIVVATVLLKQKATKVVPVRNTANARDFTHVAAEAKDLWNRFPKDLTVHITGASTVTLYGDLVFDGTPVRELPNYNAQGTTLPVAKQTTVLLKQGRIEVTYKCGGTLQITPRSTLAKTGTLTCPANSQVEVFGAGSVKLIAPGSYEAIDLEHISFRASGQLKATSCDRVDGTGDIEVTALHCKTVSLFGIAKGLLFACQTAIVGDDAVVMAEACSSVLAQNQCVIRTRNCDKVEKVGGHVAWENIPTVV